jgi:hypothetical protein
MGGVPGAAVAKADSAPSVPDSTTNVQVAGVDESDVVKTSGDLMVSAVDGTVRVIRLAGSTTRTVGTWRPREGTVNAILLDGTGPTAIVVGDAGSFQGLTPMETKRVMATTAPGNVTVLTVLDLSDPSHPRPVRKLEIDGSRSGDVRLVNGELRLAVTSGSHGLAWQQPRYGAEMSTDAEFRKAEKRSTAANRKLIDHSTIANWIPQVTVTALKADGRADGPSTHRPLLDCAQIATPDSFSGSQTLSMVSVDLRNGVPLASWRAAGVVAAGTTLYANADHAWVATSRWNRPTSPQPVGPADAQLMFAPDAGSTQIHLFDTPLDAAPKYVASAEIKGTLLNQFAMDERAGVLRVASTTEASVIGRSTATDSAVKPSEARVSVLRLDGARLTRVGVVTGLGSGERIRGVRFDGDVGYVVTYQQTDPLYTIDLSDPTHPVVRGELKMPGYSAYLHPAGPGRLLGLGQDGTDSGQITGLTLSLFDVTDLADPRRLDRQGLKGAWSDADADHHAFTLAGNLVLVPYTASTWNAPATGGPAAEQFDAGVIAIRVDADGLGKPVVLRPLAKGPVTLTKDGVSKKAPQQFEAISQATPSRVVVHSGVIYTLTPVGVAAHDATTFAHLTFAHF